jgi:DNA-binding IclR family transcriptional regulator
MQKSLANYRRSGLIVNESVFFPGLNSAAVPIVNRTGHVCYTLSCSGLESVMSVRRLRNEIGPALKEAASNLQQLIPDDTVLAALSEP